MILSQDRLNAITLLLMLGTTTHEDFNSPTNTPIYRLGRLAAELAELQNRLQETAAEVSKHLAERIGEKAPTAEELEAFVPLLAEQMRDLKPARRSY